MMKGIKYWRNSISVGELDDMIDNKELILSSDKCLDESLRSFFIEGMMLNFPMPKIETLRIENNVAKILKGSVELNTVRQFLKGKFTLDGVLDKKFKGMNYGDTLNVRVGMHIKRNSLVVGEIDDDMALSKYSEEVLVNYCRKILDK